jgi:ATP-binding cassette subfamily B protein
MAENGKNGREWDGLRRLARRRSKDAGARNGMPKLPKLAPVRVKPPKWRARVNGRKNGSMPSKPGQLSHVLHILRKFRPYFMPQAPALIGGGLLVFAGTGVALLRPWPLAYIVDQIWLGPEAVSDFASSPTLIFVAAAFAGIAMLDGVLSFARQYILSAAGQKVSFNLRVAVFNHLQRLSLTYHERGRSGDFLNRITKDVDKVQDLITTNLIDLVQSTLMIVGMLAVMFYFDWQLALVLLFFAPLLFFTISRFRGGLRDAEQELRENESDVYSVTQETLSSIRLVKAYGREEHQSNRFVSHTDAALRASLRATRLEMSFGTLIDVLTGITTGFVVWFGVQRVDSGALSPGDLVWFVSYLRDFYKPTQTISKWLGRVSRTLVRAEKIAELLDEEPAVRDRPDAKPAPAFQGGLAFRNVTFGYDPERQVLHDVSFKAKPGQVIAVVGATGAGKSTMASLIPRLYDPSKGQVVIDGSDVREYTLESLRSQVSLVLQNTMLFHASIAENIAYGRPGATEGEIVAAAKAANAHGFIMELPEGYETVLGERGDTLSGGQRQRIAIARALVRDAPILILDEPTTGLDAKSEEQVLDALEALMKGRTTLLIAHKLSAVRRADQILVIEQGKVVEQGGHQALLDKNGRYAELYRIQMGTPIRAS